MLRILPAFLCLLFCGGLTATATEVREYEQDGIRYRETRRRVRRPVREVKEVEREETFYRERYTTEMQSTQQVTLVPVTSYAWQERWHGWWNPFAEPYLTYEWVPYTTWQPQRSDVRVPVSRRQWIPEKRTVRVQEPVLRFVEEDQVSRVAIAPPRPRFPTSEANPAVARREPLGGISQLENDPPRYGVRFNADGWTVRR